MIKKITEMVSVDNICGSDVAKKTKQINKYKKNMWKDLMTAPPQPCTAQAAPQWSMMSPCEVYKCLGGQTPPGNWWGSIPLHVSVWVWVTILMGWWYHSQGSFHPSSPLLNYPDTNSYITAYSSLLGIWIRHQLEQGVGPCFCQSWKQCLGKPWGAQGGTVTTKRRGASQSNHIES